MLEKFERREIDPDEWRAFRLVRGTYGQRQDGDVHMLRLKVPRVLDARQLYESPSALDNTCTHRGGPLTEGEISGHEVTCPWHGARFDVRTGEVVGPPAQQAVARYGVRVTESDIEVEM